MKKLENELRMRVRRYETLTGEALEKIRVSKNLSEKEKAVALDFLEMARSYFSDAKYFRDQKNLLLALAAFSYAHAWLDAGVRARLFNAGKDNHLFTLP
ncbi:MAG: DUF357 domain-containing protein [Candidatus Diapherotrites archaeon]|nr:DUF357 domain-containing protein [Candidatus Diapherotrites archaeon]